MQQQPAMQKQPSQEQPIAEWAVQEKVGVS